MTEAEALDFVAGERLVRSATLGPRGWPHVMPLWYIVRDDQIWAWTYAKSQKARNVERDSRATLQVEAGDRYENLRGVMLETHAVIHRDPVLVAAFGEELFMRYTGSPA